ncbi:MAG: hypothetical protein ACO25B_07755 [Chitinophagaceae bacterium]
MTPFIRTLVAAWLFTSVPLLVFAHSDPVKLPWKPRAITVDEKDTLVVELEDILLRISPDGQATTITDNIAKDFRGSVRPYINMMTVDASGNIYVAKNFDNEIWMMTPSGKFLIYVAEERRQSNWAPPAAHLMDPGAVEFMVSDESGNIYYAETMPREREINKLRTSVFHRISPRGERKTYLNSDGDTIKLNQVCGIGIDGNGNLYVSNVKERCIKKISPDGTVTVVAGICGKRDICPVYTPGDISKAELVQPAPIVFNRAGELFFADERMNRIIKVANNKVTTVAGNSLIQPCGSNMAGRSKEGYKDGAALTALFNFPEKVQLAIDSKDNIYILNGGNQAVRKLTPGGQVSTSPFVRLGNIC